MSAVREFPRPASPPGTPPRPTEAPHRPEAPRLTRRLASRLGGGWLPRAAWTIGRTGRPGLIGIALLLAATVFLFSTGLRVAADVEDLRSNLAAAQERASAPPAEAVADPTAALRGLPTRADMPDVLRQLFHEAAQARLAVDTAKYEVETERSSGVVRYRIAFPVTGFYPAIRTFIDGTLAAMPAVALNDLALERKSITDGSVDAQIRMTVYTRAARAPGTLSAAGSETAVAQQDPPRATEVCRPPERVVAATQATALLDRKSVV
jgi:Tfp pilus assembly protein PilO